MRTSASDLSPPSALPRGRREFWPTAEPERRAVVPKKSKEEVGSPGVVKKEGRKKLRGKKWVQVTARRRRRPTRGRELALLCLALPLLPSLPLSPIGENVFRVESRCADVLPPPPSPRRNPIYALEVYCVTRGSSARRQKGLLSRAGAGGRGHGGRE